MIKKKKGGDEVYKDMRTRTALGKFTKRDMNLVKDHINSIPRD
jgi:hypothetical protein